MNIDEIIYTRIELTSFFHYYVQSLSQASLPSIPLVTNNQYCTIMSVSRPTLTSWNLFFFQLVTTKVEKIQTKYHLENILGEKM